MARRIQVFEYEKLTLHADQWKRKLEKSELDRLYEFNDWNGNVYFTGIRDGIKFQNYVGVIQIGGLTLEILPKTDKNRDHSLEEFEASGKKWRNALLKMLAVCRHIKVDSVSEASLERRHHSILDLYFEIFLDQVEGLLRSGLIKKYRKTQGNLTALKGRLDFGKHIQQNLIHQERMYTHHEIYDQDHLINQILHRAMIVLKTISNSSSIRDRLSRLFLDFPEVKQVQIQKHHFDQIVPNRKNAGYSEALKISQMIILNYSPDIRGGQENMLALLFDMNKLWEEYIFRMLQKAEDKTYQVNFQNQKDFWESKTIRPDIVLTQKGTDSQISYVVDTKWKLVEAGNPSDDDLKQMYTYNLYWEANRSILLYPTDNESEEKFGKFHKGKDGENLCKLGFINVLDGNGNLDLGIGTRILEKLK